LREKGPGRRNRNGTDNTRGILTIISTGGEGDSFPTLVDVERRCATQAQGAGVLFLFEFSIWLLRTSSQRGKNAIIPKEA